jgi:hypothetical protein
MKTIPIAVAASERSESPEHRQKNQISRQEAEKIVRRELRNSDEFRGKHR